MARITLERRAGEKLFRCRLVGDVGDSDAVGWFRTVLEENPEVRQWPSLFDLGEYDGGITWAGLIEIAHIRGAAPAGPMNRTAVVADRQVYEELIKAIDVAYTALIARRVRLFDSEAAAIDWLNDATRLH
jgi:hypothetical protein